MEVFNSKEVERKVKMSNTHIRRLIKEGKIDLIENEIRKAVGLPVADIKQAECDGYWCELIIHAEPGKSGVLKKLYIDEEIEKKYVKVIDLSVKEGDMVLPFTGANMSLGDMFLRFDSREELDEVMSKLYSWLHIELV